MGTKLILSIRFIVSKNLNSAIDKTAVRVTHLGKKAVKVTAPTNRPEQRTADDPPRRAGLRMETDRQKLTE